MLYKITKTDKNHFAQKISLQLLAQETHMNLTINYLEKLTTCVNSIDKSSIDKAIDLIKTAWQSGKQIICFGNGGSALTAQHYITDWNKIVYLTTGKPFYGYCLADNIGILTAYANDVSYDDVFITQLKPMLRPGDLVIGISGSGNSENVLRAIDYANQNQGQTLGICGFDGGKLKNLANHIIWAPIHDMQITEDIHLAMGHLILQALCNKDHGQ
jgi:D-sedoheptulose 7-phosphate isomerase